MPDVAAGAPLIYAPKPMPQTSPPNADHPFPDDALAEERPRVYATETLLNIQELMRKLNRTPADCLHLLAEILGDLDRQIEDYEAEGDGLPFPPM